MHRALANPELISLAAGFVDQATLPVEATADAAAALLADAVEGRRALQYGMTQGHAQLRTLVARRLLAEGGAPAPALHEADVAGRTVVTTGSQQLLYLLCEALLDPGDIVLVEAPTYFVFLGILETRGARPIGVPIDEGGMRLDALEATLARLDAEGLLDRVKFLYTVSEHSNPTGLCLAADRRGPLVELARRWSKRHRIFVLEDAAYRGLTFSGQEAPSVWSHDRAGDTVILARTFSKTFSPGLKTGYGVLPPSLLDPVLRLKGNHDFGSSHLAQTLLARLMADGSYDRQVTRLAATYQRKRDVVLAALDDHLGPMAADGSVSWTRPNGGLYVWLTLPEGVDAGGKGPLFSRCVEEGMLYVPGAYAFAAEPGPVPSNTIRLSYGVPDEPSLVEGVRRLATALAGCLDPVP